MTDATRKHYSVSVERVIGAPVARVWKALVEAAEHDQWFSAKSAFDMKVGGRMRNEDGDDWLITEISPPKKLAVRWDNDNPYKGSKLWFELEPRDDGTLFRITQAELTRQQDAQSQLEGWSWALYTLNSWLTTGKRVTYSEWNKAGQP